MIIAQITDLHIGAGNSLQDTGNLRRLRSVLARLRQPAALPDILLMSGDLTEHGDAESFAVLAEELDGSPFPVLPMVGNHDTRDGLLGAFPQTPAHEGFFQYELEREGLRLLVLDTLEEGRHGAAFCETRASWLAARLAEKSDTPTLIAMHHPPAPLGLAWLDPAVDEPWIERFRKAIHGHDQVIGIVSGHLHRTIQCGWSGIVLTVCGSSAPAVALDLREIDPDVPDGRAMITEEPPVIALHKWDGTRIATHFEAVADHRVIVRYDEKMQPAVKQMMEER